MHILRVLALLVWAGGLVQAQPAQPPPRPFPPGFKIDRDTPWQREVEGRLIPRSAGVFVGAWRHWTNSLLLQATNVPVDAIVAPTAGGRVLRFSLNGENILFEPADGPKAPAVAGGYQCDIGPEGRGLPERPQLVSGRHAWSSAGDWQVQVASGRDNATGVEIQKNLRLDPETGGLHLTQWLINRLPVETSLALRDRTVCPGGGFVFFPLNKKSRHSAGWAMRRKVGEGVAFDGATPFSPRVRVLDGVLVAQAGGEATRLGADSDAGWVAYARGNLLFVKFFGYEADGNYADAGNSLEVAWDEQTVELAPCSPEVKLRQHRPYGWSGRWLLLPLDQAVASFDQARTLATRVAALREAAGKPDMAADIAAPHEAVSRLAGR